MSSGDRQPTDDHTGRREIALLLVCGVLVLSVVGLGVAAWNNGWVPGAPPTGNERAEKRAEEGLRRVEARFGAECSYGGREGDRLLFSCTTQASPDDLDYVIFSVALLPDGRIEEGVGHYSGGG